jgi:hypothetical protein
MRREVLAGSLAALVIAAGVTLAVAQEHRAGAEEASAAARAAMDAIGGDWASPSPSSEPGATWQFHVTRHDGTSSEVALDRELHIVRVAAVGSSSARHAESSREADAGGFVAQAQAAPQPAPTTQAAPQRPAWTPPSTADFERAAQAALKAVGGGTVHDVDRENEGGSTWEVEMTAADGRSMEIQLDAQFNVLFMGSERDANEGPNDSEDGDGAWDDD